MSEIVCICFVKGYIVIKTTFCIDFSWLFTLKKTLLSHNQSFVVDIFHRGDLKCFLEKRNQIVFGNEQSRAYLLNIFYFKQMIIDIVKCLAYCRRNIFGCVDVIFDEKLSVYRNLYY